MLLTDRPAEQSGTIRSHYLVIDNFLQIEVALAMRKEIDEHFGKPDKHRPDTHQIWNYWFVPEMYTYLRTQPEKVFQRAHVEHFMNALRQWSGRTLGLANVTTPYLSLYISGCRQGLHNDAKNGRFAFVYSLTRDERKTIGGETIVMHEGDLFRAGLTTASAGSSFYTAIEPKFNRLVIFDDRIPHGVERVEGPMDPVEGRFVLHGHITEGDAIINGPLASEATQKHIAESLGQFLRSVPIDLSRYHGPLVSRLIIGPAGNVETFNIIVDRVIGVEGNALEWSSFLVHFSEAFRSLKFPRANGPTVVIEPIIIGRS